MEVTGIDDPALREELDDAGLRPAPPRRRAARGGRRRLRPGALRGRAALAHVLRQRRSTTSAWRPSSRPSPSSCRRRAPAPSDAAGPSSRPASEFSGFVFKIQANMDKAHRDRVAFVRICSGKMVRGMKVTPRPHRQGGPPRQPDPVPGPGAQRGRRVLRRRRGRHPRPGHLRDRRHAHRRLRASPSRASPASRPSTSGAWRWSTRCGASSSPPASSSWPRRAPCSSTGRRPARAGDLVLGALGQLQFEVVKYRLEAEYGVEVRVEAVPWVLARWPGRADGAPVDLERAAGRGRGHGRARRPRAAGGALRPGLGAADRRARSPGVRVRRDRDRRRGPAQPEGREGAVTPRWSAPGRRPGRPGRAPRRRRRSGPPAPPGG